MQFQLGQLRLNGITLAITGLLGSTNPVWAQELSATDRGEKIATVLELHETQVVATAENQARQALGSSVITAEDIARRPPINDLSELIRREPGVNLTGNSATGARGNSRQIDIRGMGPENTLILIDGRPVTSRTSARYGWGGDRDTRGDTNWVPADMIERIEVLRGPAAARYGSGAMGGVVNIITKQPTDELHGSITMLGSRPQDPAEGDSNRADFSLTGPIGEGLLFRAYGSANKTNADALGINSDHQAGDNQLSAGREGVRNRDLNGLLRWDFDERQSVALEAGYSRQGNIFAGDTQWNGGGDFVESLYGHQTNLIQRTNYALTHTGFWDWGDSKTSVSYDYTRNWRQGEGLAGRVEGAPEQGAGGFTSKLKNLRAMGEVNIPLSVGFEQTITLGAEWLRESLGDPGALRGQAGVWGYDPPEGAIPGFSRGDDEIKAYSSAIYAEDNILATDRLTLTPGLRFDSHHTFGDNWSPRETPNKLPNSRKRRAWGCRKVRFSAADYWKIKA